jgi:hypothetical protein
VFDRYGSHGCGGHDTIRFFARAHGVDERRLLAEPEAAIVGPPRAGPAGAEPATFTDTIDRR